MRKLLSLLAIGAIASADFGIAFMVASWAYTYQAESIGLVIGMRLIGSGLIVGIFFFGGFIVKEIIAMEWD